MPLFDTAEATRPLLDDAAGSAARRAPPAAFGVRSAIAKDNIYWFGTRGLIFTSPWVFTGSTERQPAVILLSASGRPLDLVVGGRLSRHRAFAIAPLTRRGLRAIDVGLISVNVQPDHPCFGAFCEIDAARALPRAAFARFDTLLVRAYEGRISQREAERLFEDVVETAAAELRVGTSRDEHSATLRALLEQHPDCSLAEVAGLLDVSYTRASQLFARAIGLPLRSYQHWIKCMRATQFLNGRVSLTEIAQLAGFSDSAHLTRAWQRRYGLPPSYLRDRTHVRIFD